MRIQKNVPKPIQKWTNVSKRIQKYPNISKRIQNQKRYQTRVSKNHNPLFSLGKMHVRIQNYNIFLDMRIQNLNGKTHAKFWILTLISRAHTHTCTRSHAHARTCACSHADGSSK